MAKTDPNRVLRRLPIVVGGLGGILLLINRLLTAGLTDTQAVDSDWFIMAASSTAIA